MVCISTPILAEDSTHENLALSLVAILERLGENAKKHDYLVGLLLVLLAESGFRVSPLFSDDNKDKWINRLFPKFLRTKLAKRATVSSNITSQSDPSDTANISTELDDSLSSVSEDQNARIVYIPQNWKSQTGTYKISLVLNKHQNAKSKLIATPQGDKMILNMIPCTKKGRTYNLIVDTLKYVNPWSCKLSDRYKNLKEISHKFKDDLVTPTRTDILSSLGLMSPSLPGLPTELQHKILSELSAISLMCLAQCSYSFSQLCSDTLIWQKLLYRDFYGLLSISERADPQEITDARERYIKSLRSSIERNDFYFKYKSHMIEKNNLHKEKSSKGKNIVFMYKQNSKTSINLHPKYYDHTLITPGAKEPLSGYYKSMIWHGYDALVNPKGIDFRKCNFSMSDDEVIRHYVDYHNKIRSRARKKSIERYHREELVNRKFEMSNFPLLKTRTLTQGRCRRSCTRYNHFLREH